MIHEDDPPVVELVGISKTFEATVPVEALKKCSLTIRRGDYVAVQGPSGSGKSTFLNILGLLEQPSSGVYRFTGHSVAELSERELASLRAHRIGFVFQAFHLVNYRSVVENVELGGLYQRRRDSRTARVKAVEALAQLSLTHRMGAYPSTLSGGERQRVAIARALFSDPSLLLCDEPTGNLDSATTESLLDALGGLNGSGMTIVTATHDPVVAARAHRRVLITDGVLTEP